MTPAARLQATIDLLDQVLGSERPADAVASAYFRNRRFIGAKDRVAVAEGLYAILRRRIRLGWWLDRVRAETTARTLAIADLTLSEGRRAEQIERLFDGARFAPQPLSAEEWRVAKALETHTLEHPHMSQATRVECPDWAWEGLSRIYGAAAETELRALQEPAQMDLRVNPLVLDREAALRALREGGVEATATPWSPWGMRVRARAPLGQLPLFRSGGLEIQDEGSQLIGLLTGARPGEAVADFCAGAGGKSLVLGAMMGNKGRLIALDVLDARLARARERLRRAGLSNVQARPLASESDKWVKRNAARFDRVLVDAPCSGTGTWRRNPDTRWRTLGPGLARLVPLQARILANAARLVRPGGRLVYATCSLLPEENEAQIEAFLAARPDFRPVPVSQAWAESVALLPGAASQPPVPGPWLRLTPARHGTDGFFAAVLERDPTAPANETWDEAAAAPGPDPREAAA